MLSFGLFLSILSLNKASVYTYPHLNGITIPIIATVILGDDLQPYANALCFVL